MKAIKTILVISIFSIYSFVHASTPIHPIKDVIISKDKLVKTIKGKDYYSKFTKIIDKYKDNKEVLSKLQSKIKEIKARVNEDEKKYSNDIVNLVMYMDLAINYYYDKQNVIVEEETEEEEIIEVEPIEEPKEEETETVITNPGFSDDYNDTKKTLTVGTDFIVISGKTSSKYESVEVGSLNFYIEGLNISNLKQSLNSASLYLEGTYIDKATIKDVEILSSTKAIIKFENIKNFIVPQKEVSFRLGIKANSIGYEKIGKTMKDLIITKVSLYDAIGLSSGNKVNAFTTNVTTDSFSLVPGIPIVSVVNNLNESTVAKINISGNFGNNTVDNSNSTPKIKLNKIKFLVHDSGSNTIYKFINSNDSGDSVIGTKNGSLLEFNLSGMSEKNRLISDGNGKNFEVFILDATTGITLKILKEGLFYDVLGIDGADNLNINMKNDIDLGFRVY